MCPGDSDVPDGEGDGGRATASAAAACSICLDAVMAGACRSTAKLQCGHEFHLDCIGSAFNAKGMMQCPNCRKVEKGNWLYGNGYCFLPSTSMDEWTQDEDLYENYLEMPHGFHWCPVNRIARVTSSLENGEPLSSVAFHELVGHHATFTELPSISLVTQPCPHLAYFHALQLQSAPTSYASSAVPTDTRLYWSQVMGPTEFPATQSLPTNDAHDALYNGWGLYPSTFSQPRDIATASNQAAVSRASPHSTRIDSGGPTRGGSLFYSFIGRHRPHISPALSYHSSNQVPAGMQELHQQGNISGEYQSGYAGLRQSASTRNNVTFAGPSLWSPADHSGFYIYPPISFSSTVEDLMNTGDQFQASERFQFMPFTSQPFSLPATGSMESGSWIGFWRRHASEQPSGQAGTVSPTNRPMRPRPSI